MDKADFIFQLERLTTSFPGKEYDQARMEMIWQKVKDLSAVWFANQVDYYIGGKKVLPTAHEIGQDSFKEFRRTEDLAKKDISDKFDMVGESIFSPEDRKMMMDVIRRMMIGKVDSAYWDTFYKWLVDTASKSKQRLRLNC